MAWYCREKSMVGWDLVLAATSEVHHFSNYGRRVLSQITQKTMEMKGTDLIILKSLSVPLTWVKY